MKQAVLTNGRQNIYILTDTNFELYAGYNCVDISAYAKVNRPFDALYKHHSTNSFFFEKTCFDRWFIINDVIRDHGIGNFVYADCDVLILEDLKPVYNNFIKDIYDGTMMFFADGKSSITSAHTSFWNTKLLADFCSFITATYADKKAFEDLLERTLAGEFYNNRNVSDMILLDVFRTHTQPNTLNLLSLEDMDICFDFNIGAAFNGCNYVFELSIYTNTKKIIRQSKGLFGKVINCGSIVHPRFYTLHFQGYLAKALIPVNCNARGYFGGWRNYILGNTEFLKRRATVLKNRLKASFLK
ncbi:hypothetical protein [Mucilaginibacter glaciei]|uniref:Nucleotide-diphospho-sugar transferase n=1 Tax=Mucilaginibacter glaciei TaxID=2772109 RepID=A0A926NX31_9SPHI|nr:hypothetical protein [Mucilaginibacter glaciei]MBD1393289.1 hypothetical protein [Mucilaginibacter glaciei]